ncbi:organic hydroperoxide resistance protein [Prosthecomicrobium pneumaticum]|uniref:Ohr subfamily peroxiredoxin n=1 Tax=Prosthecomicrobium pneumaticum TaxID=81895 RepID=A0A7W9FMD9_9HYPH|nr:organic hydroperoxide resistance protein [Prosthecomicrobium pneumaticum]MBB5753372.1 Ohr subfamily peroxiredoxin [Prosthecomicrobium pneumaticum]
MATLYTAKVKAVGGRHGAIRSEDGLLDVRLALPKGLGGKEDATNPEQLFAGGYAACFENAVLHVARRKGSPLADEAVEVVATVGIGPNATGGFELSAALDVVIAGIGLAAAEDIVAEAHAVCPYSNAVRGNIDVAITVAVR